MMSASLQECYVFEFWNNLLGVTLSEYHFIFSVICDGLHDVKVYDYPDNNKNSFKSRKRQSFSVNGGMQSVQILKIY